MAKKVLSYFKKHKGYITGNHIVYTSGKHGEAYLNKDAIYPHTKDVSAICREIAGKFKDQEIEVVVAPALGGIILSQWTAYHLSKLLKKAILGVYTEKTPEKNQIFTRGYGDLVKDKNVLIVEDITTTGGSVMKVINSVKEAQGVVKAVCALVNRDPQNISSQTIGVPYYSLAEVAMESWDAKDCPLCKKKIPVNTTVGKGREFLSK